MTDDGGVTWEAPAPGVWGRDPAHFPAPLTGFSRRTDMAGSSEGFRADFARYGHATLAIERAVVNGWLYGQRVPIDSSRFAEREAAAQDAIGQRLWRVDGERWFTVERPKILEDCRSLQAIDPAALDDPALGQHLLDALKLHRQANYYHFSHVAMAFVVGDWLLAAERWAIAPHDAYGLLAGASPATAAAARDLARVAEAVQAAGLNDVESLDQIRAASTDAAAALDHYLATYGWRAVAGFDLDAAALIEMPEAILTSIRTALMSPFVEAAANAATVRDQVPVGERDQFDELLAEARYVYGIRDDDVAPCMWTRGLIRRAVLEIGQRLLARGGLHDRDHAIEAGADELVGAMEGAVQPDADELAERAALRERQAALTPPPALGVPPERTGAELPPTVARVARATATYMGRAPAPPAGDGDGKRVTGTGVGTNTYVGRACVAPRIEDAVARLAPGDVLVTTMTTPAFNSILPIAGALVVEYGGLTSHSGIMARELGLPAALDASGCMTTIPDGAQVEVDPKSGIVRIL